LLRQFGAVWVVARFKIQPYHVTVHDRCEVVFGVPQSVDEDVIGGGI
jgi:hypothetical protein